MRARGHFINRTLAGDDAKDEVFHSVVTKTFVSVHRGCRPVRWRRGVCSLKPHVPFNDIARRLTDAWLTNAAKTVSAEALCRSVESLLRIDMLLAFVDIGNAARDWRVTFVRRYGIPTTLFDARALQADGNLRSPPERTQVERHIIDACGKAVSTGRPDFCHVDEKFQNIHVVGDRLILPDPSGAKSWCIILAEVHAILDTGRPTRFDDVDRMILQLLREGLSARDIGAAIELSPRTIEHRIEKMKARTGVNAIVRLLPITG